MFLDKNCEFADASALQTDAEGTFLLGKVNAFLTADEPTNWRAMPAAV